MRCDLHDVIHGVGMRLGKVRSHRFVDALAALGVEQLGKDGSPGGKFVLEPEERGADLFGLRSGYSDDADATPPGSGGNGDNRVIKVQGFILAYRQAGCGGARFPTSDVVQVLP